MKTNLALIAMTVWGAYLIFSLFFIPKMVFVTEGYPYPVGDNDIKDCTDKGGEFKALMFDVGGLKATCTLPNRSR